MSAATRVAFVCSSGLHVTMFAPVIELLRAAGRWDVIIYSLDPFYHGIHGDVSAVAHDHGLASIVVPVHITRPQGRAGVGRYLRTALRMSWHGGKAVRSIFCAHRPRVVILGNDTGHVERAFIRVARAMGICTVLVQDGFVLPKGYRLGISMTRGTKATVGNLHSLRHQYGDGGCDVICTLSDFWSQIFLAKSGWRGGCVQTVGSTVLDVLRKGKRTSVFEDAQEACARAGTVVFFTTNFVSGLKDYGGHRRQIEEIKLVHMLLLKRYGENVRFVVKIHPADDFSAYEEFLSPGSSTLTVVKDADRSELITKSWFCLTNFSSMLLQCVVQGRVGLLSNIAQYRTPLNWISAQFSEFRVSSLKQMEEMLRRLEDRDKYLGVLQAQQDHIRRYVRVGEEPGAARRIAVLIEDHAGGGTAH